MTGDPLYRTAPQLVDVRTWLVDDVLPATVNVAGVPRPLTIYAHTVPPDAAVPFVLLELAPGEGPTGPMMGGDQMTSIDLAITVAGATLAQAFATLDLIREAIIGRDPFGQLEALPDLAGLRVMHRYADPDLTHDVVAGVPQAAQTFHLYAQRAPLEV